MLATWKTGAITVEDLDGFLMQLPYGQRFPGENTDPDDWLEERTGDLFVRMVFSGDDVDFTDEPGFTRALDLGARAVLAREYLRRQQTSFQVSETEARAFYDRHAATWAQPERRAFMHIFIAADGADPDAIDKRCGEAAGLREAILAGASFEESARRHSDSANAATGGQVAPVSRDQLRPEIAAAVFSRRRRTAQRGGPRRRPVAASSRSSR